MNTQADMHDSVLPVMLTTVIVYERANISNHLEQNVKNQVESSISSITHYIVRHCSAASILESQHVNDSNEVGIGRVTP